MRETRETPETPETPEPSEIPASAPLCLQKFYFRWRDNVQQVFSSQNKSLFVKFRVSGLGWRLYDPEIDMT